MRNQKHGGKAEALESQRESVESQDEAPSSERLHFLYMGDVDTDGAAIWTGWVIASHDTAVDKARGIAYEGKCTITIISIPRASVAGASVAATVEKVTFEQARAHYRFFTTRPAQDTTRTTQEAQKVTEEAQRTAQEALCPS